MSVLPLDQDARSTVVGDLHRNLFVEAGAGTGKTTTLVARIVRVVASGRLADIRQLAAITFTEAAAAELRDRIRTALERASDPAAPSELTPVEQARCGAAATRIDEAVITTLHGFAQRILAEHPVAAHLPPAFEVDEGIPAELEFVHRWQAFVDRLVADPALTETLRVGATLDLLLPRLAEVARTLKDRWDRLVDLDLDVDLDGVGGDGSPHAASYDVDATAVLAALDRVAELHAPHAGADDKLADLIETRVLPLREACLEAAATGDPLEVLRVLDAVDLPTGGNLGTAERWGRDNKAAVLEQLQAASQRSRELLDGLRSQVVARLAPELVRFTLEWADERRRAGRIHFHDLLVLARNLLWRDAEVRTALAQRWSVLVVDEFQDTDPLQVELVFALAAADPSRLPERWSDIELGPGRVLVVGDPKQSIYGFRGADITLWNRTRERFGDGVVRLTQNFRSVDGILAWVNEVFDRLIGEGDGDLQPSYSALTSYRTSLDAGHQVLFLGGESTDRAATVRLREAEEIALAIATLRASGHQVADDRPGAAPGDCRPMRHDDIAILVPTRSPIGALERALDEHDIPYRIESRSLVWRTDAVRDVLNLLTALEDPADDVAVVAALRSPAFACTDPELLAWRKAGGRWDHTRLAPEHESIGPDHPVAVAMATLRRWHDERHWKSVDAVVDEVIAERRLVELTMAQRRPRDHWRRLRFVADQARAFVEAGGASLAEFLAWTSLQVEAGATAIETVVPEPDDEAVRILTVHGSKGLEFPVVVLAGLANGRAPAFTDVAWTADGPELMVTAYGGRRRRFATAGWAAAKEGAAAFERSETTRLLYVAATRARDTLIVSLHHPVRAERDSLVKQLYPVVAETAERWTPSPPPAPVPLFREPAPVERSAAERAAWLAQHSTAMAAASRGLSVSPTGLRVEAEAAAGAEAQAGGGAGAEAQAGGADGTPAGGDGGAGAQGRLFDDEPAAAAPAAATSADRRPATSADRRPAEAAGADDIGAARPGRLVVPPPEDDPYGGGVIDGAPGAERGGRVEQRPVDDDPGDDDAAMPEPGLDGGRDHDDGGPAGSTGGGPLPGRGGTAVGRAVHAVLEHAPLAGTAPIDDAVLAALVAEAAAFEGVPASTVAELAGSALASVTLAEARSAGRLWREVPIVVPMGDRILEGFIDLLYERADGSVVVVDWKTDKGRSEAEVDASLARYRTQGAAYAAAITTATGRPVAEVRFVFCRAGGHPAVERSITDLAGAVAEVEALLR